MIPEDRTFQEKVIYTCRVGSEEVPALQIVEVRDWNGHYSGVAAHLTQPKEVHLMVSGARPEWDYSAISARSETDTIKISFQPKGQRDGYNWVLLLRGKETNFQQRVKDCGEVSDE